MSKDKFYSTKAWEAMRMRVIRESRHKCQNCARYGKMQDATTVHHANPIEERPDLRLKVNAQIDRIGRTVEDAGIPPLQTLRLGHRETEARGPFPIERSLKNFFGKDGEHWGGLQLQKTPLKQIRLVV